MPCSLSTSEASSLGNFKPCGFPIPSLGAWGILGVLKWPSLRPGLGNLTSFPGFTVRIKLSFTLSGLGFPPREGPGPTNALELDFGLAKPWIRASFPAMGGALWRALRRTDPIRSHSGPSHVLTGQPRSPHSGRALWGPYPHFLPSLIPCGPIANSFNPWGAPQGPGDWSTEGKPWVPASLSSPPKSPQELLPL